MYKFMVVFAVAHLFGEEMVNGCLITNCPRGGKRDFKPREGSVQQCISCGPSFEGQCFGPNICCGPFGCLLGTAHTLRCLEEGQFRDPEPCVAGERSCRGNTGRCAADGICCSQDSCREDESCKIGVKEPAIEDFYKIFGGRGFV